MYTYIYTGTKHGWVDGAKKRKGNAILLQTDKGEQWRQALHSCLGREYSEIIVRQMVVASHFFMYICTHAKMFVCRLSHPLSHAHNLSLSCARAHKHTQTHTSTHTHRCLHAFVCIYANINLNTHIHIHISYISICAYIYLQVFIHTHMHTLSTCMFLSFSSFESSTFDNMKPEVLKKDIPVMFYFCTGTKQRASRRCLSAYKPQ